MGNGIMGSHTASRTSTPVLPAMFGRYKARVEQELSHAMPSAQDSALYTLLRYHLGWTDRYGRAVAAPVSQGKALRRVKLDEALASLEAVAAPVSQGKALRPTLCLFACEALDGDLTRALPAAAALELIHNFSLIHDDIQDRDVERRHQPTVWQLWGVARALVAGDAMQGLGDLALLNTARLGVSPETSLKVSQLLTESCLEMIQGQCLDLEFEARTSITTGDYLEMIACKTGALIRSGLEMGTMLATDDPASFQAFSRFGSCLGRVFQIRDDYLGIWGDAATTGKATGNDIRRRKKSFPVVFALERATGRAREDLLQIYSQPSLDEDDVARVLAVLDEVGAAAYAQQLTEESAHQSLRALEAVSLPAWARAEVEELVDFLARRDY